MRETDRDWTTIGQQEPFYGVLSNPKFLQANITDDGLEEFWRSGVVDVEHILRTARHHFGAFRLETALDFGCGVGRLTRAIARECASVTGVDISPGMLEIARKDAAENTRFASDIPDATVDWVNSLIVLQHIPPRRGYEIFGRLIDIVAPGGIFTIHATIYKDAEYLDRLCDEFTMASWDGETLRNVDQASAPDGAMLMFDYDLTRLIMAATTRGFDNFYMDHVNHGGCHGVVIYGQRRLG